MSVAIPPAVAAFLGTKDPAAVVIAAFRNLTEPLRDLHNAVVARSGLSTVTVTDADPKKRGNQRATIALRSSSRDGPAELAAKFAVLISRGKGGLYLDEARRRFKVGGLEGPEDLNRALAFTDGVAFQPGAKNLDPVTLTIIVGAVVPILVAVIPGLLPMVLEWGRNAFSFLSGGQPVPGGPGDGGPPPEAPPAPITDLAAWTEPSPELAGLPPIAVVGVLGLLAVIAIRKWG